MKFSNYLDSNLIFTDVKGTNMEEVIKDMMEKLAAKEKNLAARKDEITQSVIKKRGRIFYSNRKKYSYSPCKNRKL